MWSKTGRELFYKNGHKMMAVPVETGATLRAGKPMMLFESASLVSDYPGFQDYDVAADGRFAMILGDNEDARKNQVNVVLGWGAERARSVTSR